MPVTSDTLFHFTSSLSTLKLILKDNFKLSYCKEGEAYVAMCCFCDIPLSQINNHIGRYGSYGIGLSKEWAIKKELNPVMYLEDSSYFSRTIKTGRRSISFTLMALHRLFEKVLLDDKPQAEQILEDSGNLVVYLSNHMRFKKSYSQEIEGKNYRFYDEREWRFVPPVEISISGPIENYQDLLNEWIVYPSSEKFPKLENGQRIIEHYTLDFDAPDIKYLIVKSDKDIPRLIKELRRTKRFNLSNEELDILISKILTLDTLKSDF